MESLTTIKTINWPIVIGCELLTEGCESCPSYISSIENKGVTGYFFKDGFDLRVLMDNINIPSHNPNPTVYQVALGSDLFHESVLEPHLKRIFTAMNESPRHTFLITTKRAERMGTASKRFDLYWSDNIVASVSIESGDYKWRIEYLRLLKAKKKTLSFIPLLGPMGTLDLSGIDLVFVAEETWGLKRHCDEAWISEVEVQCRDQGVAFFLNEAFDIWEAN